MKTNCCILVILCAASFGSAWTQGPPADDEIPEKFWRIRRSVEDPTVDLESNQEAELNFRSYIRPSSEQAPISGDFIRLDSEEELKAPNTRKIYLEEGPISENAAGFDLEQKSKVPNTGKIYLEEAASSVNSEGLDSKEELEVPSTRKIDLEEAPISENSTRSERSVGSDSEKFSMSKLVLIGNVLLYRFLH